MRPWCLIALAVVAFALFMWGLSIGQSQGMMLVPDYVWHCTVGWHCPPTYSVRTVAYGVYVAGRGLWGLVSYLFVFGIVIGFAVAILVSAGRVIYQRVRRRRATSLVDENATTTSGR